MALPLPSSPHWAPTRTIAGTDKDYQFAGFVGVVVLKPFFMAPVGINFCPYARESAGSDVKLKS